MASHRSPRLTRSAPTAFQGTRAITVSKMITRKQVFKTRLRMGSCTSISKGESHSAFKVLFSPGAYKAIDTQARELGRYVSYRTGKADFQTDSEKRTSRCRWVCEEWRGGGAGCQNSVASRLPERPVRVPLRGSLRKFPLGLDRFPFSFSVEPRRGSAPPAISLRAPTPRWKKWRGLANTKTPARHPLRNGS